MYSYNHRAKVYKDRRRVWDMWVMLLKAHLSFRDYFKTRNFTSIQLM